MIVEDSSNVQTRRVTTSLAYTKPPTPVMGSPKLLELCLLEALALQPSGKSLIDASG